MEINRNPTARQLLWFGIVLGPFFALLGWIFTVRWGTSAGAGAWIIGGSLTLVYLAVPPLRRRIYVTWIYAVYPIGWTISHLVLGLVFFGLLMPIGRLMRLLGHDPLNRRSPAQDSYWVQREQHQSLDRYFKQF